MTTKASCSRGQDGIFQSLEREKQLRDGDSVREEKSKRQIQL